MNRIGQKIDLRFDRRRDPGPCPKILELLPGIRHRAGNSDRGKRLRLHREA